MSIATLVLSPIPLLPIWSVNVPSATDIEPVASVSTVGVKVAVNFLGSDPSTAKFEIVPEMVLISAAVNPNGWLENSKDTVAVSPTVNEEASVLMLSVGMLVRVTVVT